MEGTPEKRRSRKSPAAQAADAVEATVPEESAPPLASATTAPTATAEIAATAASEPMRECPGCGRDVPRSVRECPYCQFVVSRYVTEGRPEPEPEAEPELHPIPIPEQQWNPPSDTPPLTPYIAVLVAAVVIGLGSWIYARQLRARVDQELASAPAATAPLTTSPAATNPPPAGPTSAAQPAAALPIWHKVVKFKTVGTVGLASFNVRGSQWRITWSTKPPAGAPGRFSIGLTSDGSPTPVTIASTTTSKQGTTTLTGAGDYTLNINSPQPCLVMVEDYY
jgi:hypothetical protein